MSLLISPSNGEVSANVNPFAELRDAETDRAPVLRQYLRVAMRWRYVILGLALASVLLGLIITLMMTPQYTAVATVEIARESNKVTDFQGVEREASVADQEFYQTQYGLLKARSLSERVAVQLKLVDDPAFYERFGAKSRLPAFVLTNGHYPASGRDTRQRVAGEILRANLSVTPARMSRLVDIGFTSPDPAFSAKVANAWADSFIQTNLERKLQATSYGRNLLQQQLAQLKEKLDQSQRQLVGYASSERIINLPAQSSDGKTTAERSIVADDLATLNAALAQATADRIQAEARYAQGNGGAATQALRNQVTVGLRQRRAELAAEYQRLMTQFEPEYPAVKAVKSQIDQLDRSIGREDSRISESVGADYREAQARERTLQAKVDQLKSNYLDVRRRSIQYNIYQQEVDTNRALYDGLLQRFKEIGVAGNVGVNNITTVDPADVPQSASKPRLFMNLAVALAIGLGLGLLAALILEQMDEAIVDPEEVQRRLGLPLLGSVPRVVDGEPRDVLQDRKSDLVDAYLAVQTNLGFTTEHGVPRSFAVTSTRPAEGKSTTAFALAATLARAHNSKVILVDGDMRSPSVHHLAGIGHDHGLSNYLSGQDNLEELIFEMPGFGFSAMTAGPIPPNAAELLMGHRLSQLIRRLLDEYGYNHVVVDSPPVMGLADAPLIASRVEGVVYAVESHSIRSSMVKTALARLRNANARIFGGVLTKFEAQRGSYGYEYGYGYGRDSQRRAPRG